MRSFCVKSGSPRHTCRYRKCHPEALCQNLTNSINQLRLFFVSLANSASHSLAHATLPSSCHRSEKRPALKRIGGEGRISDSAAPDPARLSLKRRQYGARIISLSRQPNRAPCVYVDDFKEG